MPTVNDLWFNYLGERGYTGALNDRVQKALTSETGETRFRTINQLWDLYLINEGYTNGTLDDKMFAWLGDKGYTGSLSDRWYAALANDDVFIDTPEGPVLLCPYVMDSQPFAAAGTSAYDTFDYLNGIATGVKLAASGSGAQEAMAADDYGYIATAATGESYWRTLQPGFGKVAVEGEIVSISDSFSSFMLLIYAGNTADNNYVLLNVNMTRAPAGDSLNYRISGAGARYLPAASQDSSQAAALQVGDRIGIILDTDTGAVDFVSEEGHENFAGIAVADITDGAGFAMRTGHTADAATTDTEVKMYTKATDMLLPYPAGTTDSCLNGGLRELVAYPLDASEAEIQGLGVAERLSMSLAEQRGEFATNATTGSFYEAFAMPAGISTETADPLDLTTGAVAFEFDYSLPSHDSGGAGSSIVLRNDFRLIDPAFSNWLELRFRLQDDGTYLRDMEVGGQNVSGGAASASSKVGILIDNANGELRVWFDGVELGAPIPWLNPPPAALLAAMNVTQTNNWDGTVGLTAQNRFITDPYWFTTPFPAGSRDINGNIFN